MAGKWISIIIVTYNSYPEIEACLQTLHQALEGLSSEIIIIDNASTDNTVSYIRSHWPQVTLLAQAQNSGFAAANNIGLAIAGGNPILLLNPDTVILPGAISTLLNAFVSHPQAGVVGPKLLNPDGSLQPSCRDFPGLLSDFIGMAELYRLPIIHRWAGKFMSSLSDHRSPRQVDWLSGACLLVRKEAISAAGPMDAGFFMYSEELDWQYRMTQKGWQIWFEPVAQITHIGGASTQAVPGERIMWQYQGILRFYRLHFSVARQIAIKLLIWLVTWPKIIFLALTFRQKPRRRVLLRAFWRVLWLTMAA